MIERNLVFAALLTASVVSTPAIARSQVYVTIGPPPPIVEVVPPPRHGYVWAPGYWGWNGHKHVWAKGQWKRQYHGRAWVPDQWVQRGDRWYLERGHWG
jgi:hypothetical protein